MKTFWKIATLYLTLMFGVGLGYSWCFYHQLKKEGRKADLIFSAHNFQDKKCIKCHKQV